MTTSTSRLIFITFSASMWMACSTGADQRSQSMGPASGYFDQGSPPANLDPKDLKVWLGQPHHVLGITMIPVYRGTHAQDYSGDWASSLSTSSSKIRWSLKASHLAQINYMIPTESKAQPLFMMTPQSVVELAILAPVSPKAPQPAELVIALNDQDSANKAQLHINAPGPQPDTKPTPTFHAPDQPQPHLSAQLPHWELPGLNQPLVLACVVLDQTPPNAPADAKRVYRGQLWIKPPTPEAPVFIHKDDKLEPSSWHLRPDDSAKLEVVMSDRDGWPKRVDLIDLNTLTATTLVDMNALKDANIQ